MGVKIPAACTLETTFPGLIRFCVLLYKMAFATLRRRLHHGDVDGRKYERYDATDSETLSEPLLGSG